MDNILQSPNSLMIVPLFTHIDQNLILILNQILMNDDHHERLYQTVRKLIPPPNPIINKHIIQQTLSQPNSPPPGFQDIDSDEDDYFTQEINSLVNAYAKKAKIFDKWPMRLSLRNNIKYYASTFLDRNNMETLNYTGQIGKDTLEFNSSIQCGNLLAVFKIDQFEYDLLMQNDINSGGYTQWFNFMVGNGEFKGTIKFNIVNFYKKDSLFKSGMKPLTKSIVYDKSWKRNCHNVEYYTSEIRMQGRKAKYYKVLSFKYTFIFDNDSVQICYCLPYSYECLNSFIKGISSSSKIRVKYLGATPLKKIVTLLQISSEQEGKNKKGIVIIGRQHAGETPSSYIVQSIIEELLTATQQNQFLLSKYNFYIFPMVNVDGVSLGNYRCNFYGFDLNRCWHLQQSKKHPEIGYIKNEIKRIMKKEPIELILDVHGHSAKMNSFFYGNTFGRNNMFFPYVASKIEEFIDFGESNFTDQEYEKSNTARVVLGNLIRETGSAYTYEVSLFGGIRNGKKIPFNVEHYQNLAKSLILAMYKSNVELYKQQKFQKESLFLKEIRKELKRYEGKVKNRNQCGSDDEAKRTSQIQEKAKIAPIRIQLKKHASEQTQFKKWELTTQSQYVQTTFDFLFDQFKQFNPILPQTIPPVEKIGQQAPEVKKKISFTIRKVQGIDQTSRKHQLMSKLRIFGSTFTPQNSLLQYSNRISHTTSKETQTIFTYKYLKQGRISRFIPKSPQTPTLGRSFIGKHLGQARSRRKQRIYKSGSNRITHAQVNFQDLIKYNRLSFI